MQEQEERLLKEFCDTINYPIYYLSMKATKADNGHKKYIPYQYSIHIEYSNGYIEHKEFIVKEQESLEEDFVKQLCKDIPMDSTIFTSQISCDKEILSQLALGFKEYTYQLQIIMDNLRDLAKPFKENWGGLGRFNRDFSFFDLESFVNDCNCCNKEFELGLESDYVTLLKEKRKECKSVQSILLQYSKMDTLMMVEILKKLRSLR